MLCKSLTIFCCTLLFAAANAQQKAVLEHSKKMSPTFLQSVFHKNTGAIQINNRCTLKLVCNSYTDLYNVCKEVGVPLRIHQSVPEHQYYVLPVHDSLLLKKIITLPSVTFIDLYNEPREELEVSNYDPTVNYINVLHKKYPLADGTGFTVSVKENVFDTLDIDFKGRYVYSGIASNINSPHATIMATLLGGGGNTSSGSLGVAPGVQLSSATFSNLLPEPASYFQQLGISVQNHSYGTIVENFYGAEARSYDQQLNSRTTLAHIFSAGNSGTSTPATGLYAGLPGTANLTGNFKMAKNIITVGATDSFLRVPAAISKGPAYDGRIKPEITAFAEDGSSGAAAIVSGATIALQHLYRQLYGTLPEAALLRAILFNSATDIGAPGIDFSSGYGSLNAQRAAENVSNGRFLSGTVVQSATQNFTVTIPAGIKTARFTLAWNDPAASLLSVKALVNDLDITVTRLADNTRYLPWVLNSFPHPDSLRQLPQRKKDTLNNAEQVTIDNPAAGTYQIAINGAAVTTGTQQFFIAWQLDSSNIFEFAHPVKNDYFRAGNTNTVRWQHTIPGNGTLQYSYDNTNWNTIAANINLNNGYYVWAAPDTLNTARLRMLTSSGTFVSDSFIISTPLAMTTGYNCTDDFLLLWNRQRNTGSYNVFRLGAKYMEQFATVTDTFAVYTKNVQPALHYAIQPVLLNGVPAQRSTTYNYTTQAVGCYFRSLLGELSGNQAILTLELGSADGIQFIYLEKQSGNSFNTLQQVPPNGQLRHIFTDAAIKKGLNIYRARIVRTNGQVIYSDIAVVYYFGEQQYLVYPNPVHTDGVFHVIASELKNATIHLFNMNGQRVLRYKTRQFDELVPVGRLHSGMYIYHIVEEGRVVQKGKLVVIVP